MNKLETVIEKQRNQIKKLDRSVLDYQTENDELSCQNEKLSACTRDLRRKLRSRIISRASSEQMQNFELSPNRTGS